MSISILMMSILGFGSLGVAFLSAVASIVAFVISVFIYKNAKVADKKSKQSLIDKARTVTTIGHVGVFITALALTFACGILIYGFVAGDYSLAYVARYHSDATGPLALLFKISSLWGGRAGSLLFWAWTITIFAVVMAIRNIKRRDALDNVALIVVQTIILTFVCVLLFSSTNMPFIPLDVRLINADGSLATFDQAYLLFMQSSNAASLDPMQVQGMTPTNEHWAMAIHPPTLFVGYAGLTVPFAYAIAALVTNDASDKWVALSQRITIVSWLFLGIGIGLGAVWAYVELSFGGYWGWDAVENASLLSWLLAVALAHSFTVYRQRGIFKGWAIMCACLAFAFVIVGTFITRTGIVTSVHAFSGDTVSTVLFLVMIFGSIIMGIVGLIVRRKTFLESQTEQSDSLLTKDVAYFFNNVILVLAAFIITIMTLAPAITTALFGTEVKFGSSSYHWLARPITMLYCLIMAVGPLFSWIKTDGRAFLSKAKLPAIFALVLFALLMIHFVTYMVPAYYEILNYAALTDFGTKEFEALIEAGPTWWYFAQTILSFVIASLLLFTALFMFWRTVYSHIKSKGLSPIVGFFSALKNRAATLAGAICHFSMAIIFIGLVASTMYPMNKVVAVQLKEQDGLYTDATFAKDSILADYKFVNTDKNVEYINDGERVMHSIDLAVYKGERYLGTITPVIREITQSDYYEDVNKMTGVPAVQITPLMDFVVLNNNVLEYEVVVDSDDATSSDTANPHAATGSDIETEIVQSSTLYLYIWTFPYVTIMWIGFATLMLGTGLAIIGSRKLKTKTSENNTDDKNLPVSQ